MLELPLCKFQEVYQPVYYFKLAAFDMMCPLPDMVMSGFCSHVVVSFGFIFVHWIHSFKYSDCPTCLINTTH